MPQIGGQPKVALWGFPAKTTRKARNAETPIQKAILETVARSPIVAWIARNGQFVRKFAAGEMSPNSRERLLRAGLGSGSSDLIGFLIDGRFLAIEVKTEKGIESAKQIEFRERVNKAGGVAFVARSPFEAWEVLKKIKKRD